MRVPQRWLAGTVVVLAVITTFPTPGAAQQQAADSVAARLARLQARVDSLEALVRRLQATGQEEAAQSAAEQLRAAARAAAAAGAAPDTTTSAQGGQTFVGRQRSLQALNPEISATGDFLVQADKDDTNADNFIAREFEFSFQASLDPYSRAKIFVSNHRPGGELVPFATDDGGEEEGGTAVEEGYVQWVNLPGGTSLTLGRFFQRFGTLNRWHGHALPFQTRSLPHLAFLGEESLTQTGASLYWLVPVHGGGTYETWLEVTRSENAALFGDNHGLSVLGHVNGFWQLTDATDLDVGLSWINGTRESGDALMDQNLYGAEMAFTWRPPNRSRYRDFTFRGGVMVKDPSSATVNARSAKGVWSMAEMRLSPSWLVGGRYDWVENPDDPDQTASLVSPTLTWWQSEFVRVRAEYDFLRRSFGEDTGKLVMQVTFAMGPHKHENY